MKTALEWVTCDLCGSKNNTLFLQVKDYRYGHPTVFWQRRVFNQLGGFDESLRFVADCDFWMKAGGIFKIIKINEFLSVDRNHSQEKGLQAELH